MHDTDRKMIQVHSYYLSNVVSIKGGFIANLIFVLMDKMMEISLSPKISISVRGKIIYNRLGSKKRPTGH
ncbi:hypothetical protein BS1321_12080 [Peribacillus simplex NBRC 15720 = DSM 1321]|uniref:Uncharacterized protein n=1 Tax=Peribacillus simplex NBRC 15720 = DSM 1321 TaxID=1349754 RepID=A0A223EH79_9BACI|nr:hypothetical protein BS1321_12080 [Peribacillus simplex NBRC 15720 = DSM 1321]